jgi:hypothetical protein
MGGKKLVDGRTIFESGIKQGSVIILDYENIDIKLKLPSGKTIKISVDPDNKIESIRDAVKER